MNYTDYPFIRFPRALADSPEFSDISIEARTLLALILDRLYLSEINSDRFTDENGRVYVIFTIDEICHRFNCSNTKATRILKELELNKMIVRNRKNRLSPYRIYITDVFYDLIKNDVTTHQNSISRDNKIKSHDIAKRDANKNNKSKNNTIKNNSSIIKTEEEIMEQIEYDCIVNDDDKKTIDEIVMIMFDVFNGTSPFIKIGNDDMSRDAVVSRFNLIDSEHIIFVLMQLDKISNKIFNSKSYIKTLLYNAPATMDITLDAEVEYNLKKKETAAVRQLLQQ